MTGHVEVFKGKGLLGGWHWRLVGGNGEITAASESYVTKWNAKRAAVKVAAAFGVEAIDVTAKPYRRFP